MWEQFALALLWVITSIVCWKLGEKNESQTQKIEKSDSIIRGLNARERAAAEWLSKHKQG